VQRQFAGLAELSVTDDEQPVNRVEVVAVEADCFPNTHPGHGQQGNQGSVGRHPVRRVQCAGGGDQGGNVLF